MRIGSVIVSHQSAVCLRHCIYACRQHAAPDAGIVVVDNASTDGSPAIAAREPGVTGLANAGNVGFAAAVNQGFRALPDAECVLVLNPDAILETSLAPLVRCFDVRQVAIAAGALCDSTGEPQRGFTLRRTPT